MTFGEIFRTIITEVEFSYITAIVCIRQTSCKPLFTIILNRTVVISLLIIKKQSINIVLSELTAIIQVKLKINIGITIFSAGFTTHWFIAHIIRRIHQITFCITPCRRMYGRSIAGTRPPATVPTVETEDTFSFQSRRNLSQVLFYRK